MTPITIFAETEQEYKWITDLVCRHGIVGLIYQTNGGWSIGVSLPDELVEYFYEWKGTLSDNHPEWIKELHKTKPTQQTSEYWSKTEDFQRYQVLDPDGWDRKNFQFSWFEELVTKEEFQKRLFESTLKSQIQL